MRFLLDENVHVKVRDFLQKNGHDVQRVSSGIKNGDVIKLAVQEKRMLITQDKDFLDQTLYVPGNHLGIICIRIHPPVLEHITKALERLFREVSEAQLQGGSFGVSEEGFQNLSIRPRPGS